MRESTNTALSIATLAVCCVSSSGCHGPEGDPYPVEGRSLLVSVYDLETGIHPGEITIDLWTHEPWLTREEFETSELPSWSENFRLVRWPDATPVEGTWTFDWERPSAEMQFVPAVPFEEGWYAVQIRPDQLSIPRGFNLGYRTTTRDGWATVRFHVGSFPLLLVSGGVSHPEGGRGGGGHLGFVTSEPVFAGASVRPTDIVTITVGGERLACTSIPEGVEAGARVGLVSFECPGPEERAALAIDVVDLDWTSESGSVIRPCGTHGGARWDASTGDYLEWDCDLETLIRTP